MQTLESYLAGECQTDRADVRSLERMVELVAASLRDTFVEAPELNGGTWPYQRREHDPEPVPGPAHVSQGTLAMVLAAVGKITGFCHLSDGKPARLPRRFPELEECWKKGVSSLTADVKRNDKVHSGSFGDNDPITLSHIADLLIRSYHNDRWQEIPEETQAAIRQLLDVLCNGKVKADLLKLCKNGPAAAGPMLPHLDKKKTYLRNSFVPARVIRVFHDLETLRPSAFADSKCSRDFRSFFEGAIHAQLSYSTIQDSRFDPAQLMFALEGLILFDQQSVDAQLFQRIINVLEDKQKDSAHWRPNRPLYATAQGDTMLPISVEGANSLLRSFLILSERREFLKFSGQCSLMLRRFWHWLRARVVQFDGLIGWHSEHVNDPLLIHIWDTSQVIEFMLGYRTLLQHHIADETLRLSGVNVEGPQSLKDELGANDEISWQDVIDAREPVRTLGRQYQIYKRIGTDFIEPWKSHASRRRYSMLLYGPPGTGKTALARLIAAALEMPLISISVSDFLGGGGAMVEARAKAIFEMLEVQSDCVILFDEIDSFLLDRDSQHYRDQDTIFQFLTPGMLTKVHGLRTSSRSIFIIATNYENRIDPAIKRPGRVDEKYLLLPPDALRRAEILNEFHLSFNEKERAEIEQRSLFLGYGELKGVANMVRAGDDLGEALKTAERSTGGEFYGRRAYIDDPFPIEEAACLYSLASEVGLAEGSGESDGDRTFKYHFERGFKRAGIGRTSERPKLETDLWEYISQRGRHIGMQPNSER